MRILVRFSILLLSTVPYRIYYSVGWIPTQLKSLIVLPRWRKIRDLLDHLAYEKKFTDRKKIFFSFSLFSSQYG
jgi:hypothetical protein